MSASAKVARAARKAALARKELEDAICKARTEGVPLRAIAEAAGMSHEKVRQLAG